MRGYKLAIDMCYFGAIHRGGKDEVAYNLLRGFEKIGVSDQIVCFAYKDLVPILKTINSNIKICVLPRIKLNRRINIINRVFRFFYEERWSIHNKVEVMLFPNKKTPVWKWKIPTVAIMHDIQAFEYDALPGVLFSIENPKRHKRNISRDFKYRDAIIAISDYDKNEMIKYLPQQGKKIIRIYDPVSFSSSLPTDEKKKYITVINIQWLHKNVKTVIEAFAEIAGQIEQDLILIGKEPKNISELKKMVEAFSISDRVVFTGFVEKKKLEEIISQTRVYVNASCFEGFGMTAVEMMASKVPTIVANSTAMPEVTMGLCRYYSPASDFHALADQIMEELKHPYPQERLEKIASIIRDQYSYEKITREYWNLINQLAKKETWGRISNTLKDSNVSSH